MKPARHNCQRSVVRKSVPRLIVCEINAVVIRWRAFQLNTCTALPQEWVNLQQEKGHRRRVGGQNINRQNTKWFVGFLSRPVIGSIFWYFVCIIPTWFGILSGSSRTKKCLFYILCCSGHFLARFFWVLGVGRPVSLKNPNNPFLGWLKTLSNDDNDLRYSPPAWRRGSAKSSKTRGHVAHSGVSEQGPLCLFTFLTFCLSAFLT